MTLSLRLRMADMRCRGPLYPGSIVFAEGPNPLNYVLNVFLGDFPRTDDKAIGQHARLGLAAQIEDHLQQLGQVSLGPEGLLDIGRQLIDERVEFGIYCFLHLESGFNLIRFS